MKIESFKIRGYRTVRAELELPLGRVLTLVGPNNCGKTNALRGINSFFTGYDNSLEYIFEEDICQGEKSIQTNIQMVLSDINDTDDAEIINAIRQVRTILGIETGSDSEITLYLTFSKNSNPSYRVYPTTKRPKSTEGVTYSRAERQLVALVFSKIAVHYSPSEKSIAQLYESLIEPYLIESVFQSLAPSLSAAQSDLGEIAREVNSHLRDAELSQYQVSFELPNDATDLIRSIGFSILDPQKTPVFDKGMGIQSVSLLGALCWISKREKGNGKTVLWLLEEPESYLHPELLRQSQALIHQLAEDSQVIITTHSLGFIPSEPKHVVGLERGTGWTSATTFSTYAEATDHIRRSLGVRFSDFYNFTQQNLLVEGRTDRDYLNHVFNRIRSIDNEAKKYPLVLGSSLSIHDFDGVKGLEGFLRATYSFISREVDSVTILDGDDAGDRARRSLVGYFGNKGIPFQSNNQFVIVRDRFSIEGLLPDGWLREIAQDHPGWFDDFSVDAQGQILPFSIKDINKKQFLAEFKRRASVENFYDWWPNWENLVSVLENALSAQMKARS
ncbi:MAG: AAA family ATPase [Maritimibacter sp.]